MYEHEHGTKKALTSLLLTDMDSHECEHISLDFFHWVRLSVPESGQNRICKAQIVLGEN